MDYQERQQILRRIFGETLLFEADVLGNYYIIKYKDPTLDINIEGDFVYRQAYKNNEGEIPTIKELEKIMENNGDWTLNDQLAMVHVESNIKNYEDQAQKLTFYKLQEKIVLQRLEEEKKKKDQLLKKKNAFFDTSLEYFCARLKRKFLVRRCCEIIGGKQEWLEDDRILNNLSVLIDRNDSIIDPKTIRELARTNPFRLMWKACQEKGNNLLKKPMSEITEFQADLINWGFVYDYAYSSTDSPPQEIIENDEKFDIWYKKQGEKRDSETHARHYGKGMSGQAQEVFIPCDSASVKDVYNMNSPEAKAIIKQRKELIKKKGVVNEVDMPDTKRRLQMEFNKMQANQGK